jgi:hypothetical protein
LPKRKNYVWLGTSPNTRVEKFYKLLGWEHIGMHGEDEIKFEMTIQKWKEIKNNKHYI